MKMGFALLVCLALLVTAATSEAQSKGYRPPPPPPPPPSRPAPIISSPSRPPSSPPSRPAQVPTSRSTPQVSKSNATPSTTGGRPQTSTDYAKLNSAELQKTIGAQSRQIDSYRGKVNNPQASYPNWNSLSRERQGAVLNQWNAEIRRLETSRGTAQRALSQRTR